MRWGGGARYAPGRRASRLHTELCVGAQGFRIPLRLSSKRHLVAAADEPGSDPLPIEIIDKEIALKMLYDAGEEIGFSTDSGATPERVPGLAEHRELQLSVDAGLTPLQAIGPATANAAALLGLQNRRMLVPGHLADFVVLAADPSTSIGNSMSILEAWTLGNRYP